MSLKYVDTFERRMENAGLLLDAERSLLLCIECGYSPISSFQNHLRRHHHRHLDRETAVELDLILGDMELVDSSIYKNRDLVPALPYLRQIQGHRCSNCFYFSKTATAMKRHIKSQAHPDDRFEDCWVQVFPGTCESYFGVIPAVVAQQVPVNIEAWIRNEMNQVLGNPTPQAQQDRDRGLFYNTMGWYSELEHDSLWKSFTVIPGRTDQHFEFFTLVKQLLKLYFESVRTFNVQLRFKILAGQDEEASKVFSKLESPDSIDSYARLSAQFVLFSIRFLQRTQYSNEEILGSVTQMCENPSERTLLQFMVTAISEAPATATSTNTLLSAFLYAMTRRDENGTLMSAGDVSKICSQVLDHKHNISC